MAIYKNRDLEVDISLGTSKQTNRTASFYTGDIGSTSVRISITHRGNPFNFNNTDMVPTLDLIHSDGSIWLSEPMNIIVAENGIISYNIPDNIIQHAGTINAKLFLKSEDISVHALNFSIEILDSGINDLVEKEINLVLVEDTIQNIINEHSLELLDETFKTQVLDEFQAYTIANPQLFKGDKGDTGEQGIQGIQGIQGEKGDTGEDGIDGIDGVVTFEELTEAQKAELKGEQGIQGIEGEQGPQGIQGIQGEKGEQGIPGKDGVDGINGIDGLDGEDGIARNYRDLTILNDLPLRFSGYDALITSSGNNYYYPQGLAVDGTYIYVSYSPTGSGNPRRLIVMYDRATSTEYTKFYAGSAGGESIHVEMEGSQKFLYAKTTDGKLGKFNITAKQPSMSEVIPVVEYDVGLNYNFAKNNDDWIIEQDSATYHTTVSRDLFAVYKSDLTTPKKYFSIDGSVGGMWGTELNFNTPKRQGIVALNGNLFQIVGGNYYKNDPYTTYRAQGVQQLNSHGHIAENFAYNPNEILDHLEGLGKTVTRIEHESGFVYNGEIYSLIVYNFAVSNATASDQRYLLVKYGAPEADLTLGQDSEIVTTRVMDAYMPSVNGYLVNDFNGTNITNIKDLIKYMYNASRTEILFYSSDVTINDENGSLLSGGITVKIESGASGVYWIEYMQNKYVRKVLVIYVNSTNTFNIYNQSDEEMRSGVNLNTLLTGGTFYGTSMTGAPSAHGFVEARHTGTQGQQIFRAYNSATRYFRYYTGGSWSAWTEL